MLAVSWFLGVVGRLERVLVQLRNCLTFKIPSLITLSIPDSADLKRNRACLPSMWRHRGGTPTKANHISTNIGFVLTHVSNKPSFSPDTAETVGERG